MGNHNEKQNYRCKECGRQFVINDEFKEIHAEGFTAFSWSIYVITAYAQFAIKVEEQQNSAIIC